MSKVDVNAINTIKLLGINMIKEAGTGDSGVVLSMSNLFYNLFLNHLNFNKNNSNWINRDRLIVNNKYLPLMYSTLHMFGYDINLDDLKEYKKLNSKVAGLAHPNTLGIEIGSLTNGDVLSSAVGISLGERYLRSLVQIEKNKCNLIDFHTYVICTMDDLMSGLGYESISFAAKEKLNKLIIICNKDYIGKDSSTKETYTENLVDKFMSLNFNIIEVKNGSSNGAINDAIDEAKESKKPSIIILSTKYAKDSLKEDSNESYNMPLSDEDINNLSLKYKLNYPVNDTVEYRNEIETIVNKRMSKILNKWNEIKKESISDLKIKEIVEFLENKDIKIGFSSANFKLNDNYNEELRLGNNKIFNMFASKSPFVLTGSNDNFIYTKSNISSSEIMSNENKLGRNILFGGRTMAMGGIANGLASLGFKVFISSPLIDSTLLLNSIRFASIYQLSVNYIFTNDSIINNYENNGLMTYSELNTLRLIPNLITFRPCDINEILGIYDIISNYKRTIAVVLGNEKTPKFSGTNPKYVVAGAYRVKREKGEANGTIIATGTEVKLALEIADELFPYGIDLRVVSMPSRELFETQNDRYKFSLIMGELKTFVIEFGETKLWEKYATDEEYIFGVNNYSFSGTKGELLGHYNLTKDNIKAKIIELMKK